SAQSRHSRYAVRRSRGERAATKSANPGGSCTATSSPRLPGLPPGHSGGLPVPGWWTAPPGPDRVLPAPPPDALRPGREPGRGGGRCGECGWLSEADGRLLAARRGRALRVRGDPDDPGLSRASVRRAHDQVPDHRRDVDERRGARRDDLLGVLVSEAVVEPVGHRLDPPGRRVPLDARDPAGAVGDHLEVGGWAELLPLL